MKRSLLAASVHRATVILIVLFLSIGGLGASQVRADVSLWPFYQSDESGTTLMYPLYVQEEEFLMIFPLYYQTGKGKQHHVLWPLLKVSDGRVNRIFPVWFSEKEGNFFFFPLVMNNEDALFTLIPPVYYAKDGDTLAVFPFYTRAIQRAGTAVTYRSTNVLWPLYSHKETYSEEGKVASRKRRWLLFTDRHDVANGKRTLRLLGIPIFERVS